MILGEGVTAAAFFCYFFSAGGKKVRENQNSLDFLFPLERLFSVLIIIPSIRDYYLADIITGYNVLMMYTIYYPVRP